MGNMIVDTYHILPIVSISRVTIGLDQYVRGSGLNDLLLLITHSEAVSGILLIFTLLYILFLPLQLALIISSVFSCTFANVD